MLQELSTRLSKLIERKRLKEKLTRDLHAVETELQEKSIRLVSLGAQFDKETVDVDKLERTSLTSLFYSVLGSRDEQLEKERQELLSAQLLYQQARKQVEFLVEERNALSQRLEQLMGVESEYERLLSEKEALLRQSKQGVANELMEYSEQFANLNSELKEITEAIRAGNEVISDLEQVIKSLGSAENWGVWDMVGGGLIANMAKHSHIDAARDRVARAQAKISQFKRELADVQNTVEFHINIGELDTFADFFFDGLIMDWIVQSKIKDSLAQAEKAKSIIAQTVKQLETLQGDTQKKRDDLQQERARLIERT
jgi:chromosome segregation ATPase